MTPARLNVRMIDAIDASATDETLVSAIRRHRSEAAFALLYDRHTPRGFQTAWRIVGGNPHEAEDVVQEAWLRAVASLDRWSGESDFGAWFRGIAAHVAIDVVRRQVRFVLDAPQEFAPFIAPKGSVALNGVSLTVNEVDGTRFGVNIIPYTLTHTTWGDRKPGDLINLEVDLLARYVERIAAGRLSASRAASEQDR